MVAGAESETVRSGSRGREVDRDRVAAVGKRLVAIT
jgi:hypothetical protein